MPPVNCVSQPGQKAVPGDLFSGALSPELGWTSGTHLTGEGKTTWTGLCSVGDVSVSHLLGTFLARTETPLCVKLHTEHRGTGSLILSVWC